MWESYVQQNQTSENFCTRKIAVAELKAFTFRCIWVMAGWTRFFAVFFEFFGGGGIWEIWASEQKSVDQYSIYVS
jgi:hypothetical protein